MDYNSASSAIDNARRLVTFRTKGLEPQTFNSLQLGELIAHERDAGHSVTRLLGIQRQLMAPAHT